jgi:hypothetical protein
MRSPAGRPVAGAAGLTVCPPAASGMWDLDPTWLTITLAFGRLLASVCRSWALTMPDNMPVGVRSWRSRGHRSQPALRAPRGLALPVWRWAHRMAGLKKLTWWIAALASMGDGRADAASALGPLDRSLFADEKRQDKQQGKSIGSGRKAYQTCGFQQSYRSTAVALLCKHRTQAHLGYLSTKRKPKTIGTLAASFSF